MSSQGLVPQQLLDRLVAAPPQQQQGPTLQGPAEKIGFGLGWAGAALLTGAIGYFGYQIGAYCHEWLTGEEDSEDEEYDELEEDEAEIEDE